MRDLTGADLKTLPRSVTAVKRDVVVCVVFALGPGKLETLEGVVSYAGGDALLTGVRGERWPVRRETFFRTYAPVAPTEQGQDGAYHKLSRPVRAVCLEEEARVTIAGGELAGKAGDWLVQYGKDAYGIVAAGIFDETYMVVEDSAKADASKKSLFIG
ncbi:MAG: PGDYG domain-containing protein [Desulfovibrio sp.]|uniref:PGDYG domain-containing protein n=1 Tax=Desulfovibrio sp. TaxID=885 RepID=UPI002587C233|nr:PGDYG domain-containing protein [Desulfovibrio sp.]MCD7984058.1 PGDYG domain-containing protein [Desulfovibrio sp.]